VSDPSASNNARAARPLVLREYEGTRGRAPWPILAQGLQRTCERVRFRLPGTVHHVPRGFGESEMTRSPPAGVG
jgi:hypothetical protein